MVSTESWNQLVMEFLNPLYIQGKKAFTVLCVSSQATGIPVLKVFSVNFTAEKFSQ
jgi:hypothetical protein